MRFFSKRRFAGLFRSTRKCCRRRAAVFTCEPLESRTLLSSVSVSGNQVVFLAAAGEVNTLNVSETAGVITIQDTTSAISSTSAEFTVVDTNTVTIPALGFFQINLTLLDQNDTLDASGLTVASGLGRTIIQGGSGDDILVGSGLDDFFIEETGNDFIDGLTAIRADQWAISRDADLTLTDSSLTIGIEVDTYANIESVSLNGGVSDNTFDTSATTTASGITGVIFNGGEGDDTLIGGETRDVFQDRLGANTFAGGGGTEQDSIFFFADLDMALSDSTVTIAASVSTHTGIERIDLWGGAGDNTIDASAVTTAAGFESIQLIGLEGNDTLIGSPLADTIRDYGGANTIDGGGDDDLLILQADVDISASNSTFTMDSVASTHSNFERISLVGGNSSNTLDASGIDETSDIYYVSIQGLDGNDTILGSQVIDEIRTLGGNNTIDGGSSPVGTRDRVVFFQDLDMTVSDGVAVVGAGTNTFVNVEDLRLVGNAGDNTFDASAMTAASGVTLLIAAGGVGDDTLIPSVDQSIAQSLDGGIGDDKLDLSHFLQSPVINSAPGAVDGLTGSYTTGGPYSSFANINDIVLPPEYDFAASSYLSDEGDAATGSVVVEVTRSVNTSVASTVDIVLSSNTALAGVDFVAGPVTVGFLPGETTRLVPIDLIGDEVVELDEEFSLSFADGISGVANPTATVSITNDDSATVSIGDLSQVETDAGQTAFQFVVTLSAPVDAAVGMLADTADDSATLADSDFDALAGEIVEFTASTATGLQTQLVTVHVNGDLISEPDESFFVNLTSLTSFGRNVSFSDAQAVGTIENDDVSNLPPEIVSAATDASLESKAAVGDLVTLTALFADANSSDTHTATIDWGDGTTSVGDVNQLTGQITGTHSYSSGGIYAIAVSVSDGLQADTADLSAVVSGTRLTTDGVLQIIGTDLRDVIHVKRQGPNIRVKLSGSSGGSQHLYFPRKDVDSILVYTCGGNDHIHMHHNVQVSATINSGTGNDYVIGGSGDDLIRAGAGSDWVFGGNGNNVLLGGAGHDLLFGGWGRDILIGGTGHDWAFGGSGQDIMIGGSTIHDADDAALMSIRDEWASGKSYSVRRQNLLNGSGGGALNGSVFLNAAAVVDDSEYDSLFGGWGTDWYVN